MKKEEFEKGIAELRQARLTEAERADMLKNIFAATVPIRSPYSRYLRVFALVRRPVIALSLILVLAGASVVSAEGALPGEAFYTVKTRVIEPVIGRFNIAPEKKLVWEEKKVARRIAEAQSLADEDRLDEDRTQELEDEIEKSSAAFADAAEKAASRVSTSSDKQKERAEKLKEEFRKKLEDKEEKMGEEGEQREGREKIKRLKESAVKALESDNDGKRGKNR